MGERCLDLTIAWRKAGIYTLPGSCHNCDWKGRLILSRGSEAPSHYPHYKAAECPKCGCKAIGKRDSQWPA